MSQQPPYGQQPLPHTTKPPHRYKGWVLTALVLTYLASLVFLLTEIVAMSGVPTSPESTSSSSGILTTLTTLLILVLYGFILLLDWRNVFSLFGRIHWKRLNGWKRVGLIFLYLCVFIIPGLYLYFATQYFLGVRHQTPGSALSGVWSSYRAKSGNAQLGIALVTILVLLSFIGLTGALAVIDRENTLTSSAITPTTAPTLFPTPTQSVPTPTQKPIPTSTPKPAIVPTKAPQPTQPPKPQLFLSFTCAQAVDYSYGRVCVHSQPGAALTITVTYCTGYNAVSKSLQGTQYANSSGNYEWDWTPQTKCRGSATAYVQASWNGQSTSQSDDFTVQ